MIGREEKKGHNKLLNWGVKTVLYKKRQQTIKKKLRTYIAKKNKISNHNPTLGGIKVPVAMPAVGFMIQDFGNMMLCLDF